ncbi:hypothetical protein M514_13912 [Trichuris suis]|uniref:GIY-YIG domain-containing protein n=1 Tax=Trichuris suis TaxID=68888 RepID=A0A085LJR4_9BILA|nr:hypothetical protein M513_13912 [Trichuris suis]KFD68434.1 hypothetical protein M514_13912 [Trichuris suis]
MLRPDKVKVAPDQRPGVVYEITCTSGVLYIGETGNTLSHRFAEHLGNLTRYKNTEARHIGPDIKTRGRPHTLEPKKVMQKALEDLTCCGLQKSCHRLIRLSTPPRATLQKEEDHRGPIHQAQ